jgi:AraC-like DNA-binding protein
MKKHLQASFIPVESGIDRQSYDVTETTPVIAYYHSTRHIKEIPYNMHYGLELGVVLSGRLRRFYRDYQMDVGAGQVWLCGIWEPHAYKILKTPCERVIMIIWPPLLANLYFDEMPSISWLAPFALPPRQRPQIPSQKIKRALYFGRQLKEIHVHQASYPALWLRFLLLNIMLILYEQKSFNHTADNIPNADFISRLNRIFQSVFETRSLVTTAQAARSCGMNREIFGTLFSRWMGIRFSEFVLRYRINAAAAQLAHTREPIKHIALRFGFADSSHFVHCFQKYYRCTPGGYRRRLCDHTHARFSRVNG